MDLKQLFKSWLLIALGVLLASNTTSGIRYVDGQALFFAVLLLSLCNVVLKPILMLFSLPFIILTFGIGIWLINALLFLLVGNLVPGFYVDSFGNALWGALVVSLTSGIANLLFGSAKGNIRVNVSRGGSSRPRSDADASGPQRRQRKPLKDDDDVIDI